MRLGILTQYYPPEMGAPQARLSDLARRFREQGHEVFVLTAMPNYPTGKILRGYGGLYRREMREGVPILRSFIFPTKSVGLVRRLANYFSFVFSSLVVGATALPRLDYLMTESPPLFLGLSGFLLAKWKGARWIFNVSDLWPESAVQLGVIGEGWPLRLARALERFCYRKAWLVTGQSAEILEEVRRICPSAATYHLSNGVDTATFHPSRRSIRRRAELQKNGGSDSLCIAVYAGLHGIAQGLEIIVDVAARLRDEKELLVVLVGDGPEKMRLERRAESLSLTGLRFLDPFPREAIPELLASADIALVPLKTHLLGAVPSKLYEAMGAGVPVVLMANGEAADIVRRTGGGVALRPGDGDGLAASLRRLAKDGAERRRLGAAGRRAAETLYDRQAIASNFMRRLEGAP